MENQIPTFEDYFIESCFKIIRAQSEVIDARTKEEEQAIIEVFNEPKNPTQWTIQKSMPVQEKRINRCLDYIKMLIANSEKDGTHGLSPHSALD